MAPLFGKSKNKKSFNFMELPAELKIKIVHYAVSLPSSKGLQRPSRERIYATAQALALVSRLMREIVMPFLLETVVLHSQESINRFINSVIMQKGTNTNARYYRHPLKIDYPRRVKAIWASQCLEPLVGHIWHDYHEPEYRLLYECFANAETLGFNFNALHLLYEVLGASSYSQQLPGWRTKRVVFAGDLIRWNAFTRVVVGQLFLGNLTHLTIWVGEQRPEVPMGSAVVPDWITGVPFKYMATLTHFAFTLIGAHGHGYLPLMVYILPGQKGSKFKTWQDAGYREPRSATVFRDWAVDESGIEFGWTVWLPVQLNRSTGAVGPGFWEMAFARGEHDNYWRNPKADRRVESKDQGEIPHRRR